MGQCCNAKVLKIYLQLRKAEPLFNFPNAISVPLPEPIEEITQFPNWRTYLFDGFHTHLCVWDIMKSIMGHGIVAELRTGQTGQHRDSAGNLPLSNTSLEHGDKSWSRKHVPLYVSRACSAHGLPEQPKG